MESTARRPRAVAVEESESIEAVASIVLPHTFPLQFPVQLRSTDGAAIGEALYGVTIARRPTAGDLAAADGLGEIGTILKIVERICGLTPVQAKAIDVRDFGGLAKIVGTFLV